MKSKEKYIAEINEFLQDIDLKALVAVLAFVKLNGVTSAFSDFVEEHAEAKALDTSVFYVVLLAAAYKAGRESTAH